MTTIMSGSSLTFSNGSTDTTANRDPILRYQVNIVGNSNTNSAASTQYTDITCDAASPSGLMIMNFDYWTTWGGWSDIYFSRVAMAGADRFKTRPDSRDFLRCYWVNGAYGGPHIVKVHVFYYN